MKDFKRPDEISLFSLKHLSQSMQELKKTKNLLAFSGGVDSSALFFLLVKFGIEFDIALMNYKTRENSDKEAKFANAVAKFYKKKAYIKICRLGSNNFEKTARDARYEFFEEILKASSYEVLLTAHQLNDRLEWFLMQFCKGAGAVELCGFEKSSDFKGFRLERVLFDTSRERLQEFLDKNDLPFFIDESNFNPTHKRNSFRKITNPLLNKFESGIKKSFEFLENDKNELIGEFCFRQKDLFVFERKSEIYDKRMIDFASKCLNLLISQKQRDEAYRQKFGVLGGLVAFGLNETQGFISPFVECKMDKKFKEFARVCRIPKHIRGYIYSAKINLFDYKL